MFYQHTCWICSDGGWLDNPSCSNFLELKRLKSYLDTVSQSLIQLYFLVYLIQHLCGYASNTFCSGSLWSVTWNHVGFCVFCDNWAVQPHVQYFSLNCESNSDDSSLSLSAQCVSPRWWLLWSCHICYTGHCSGMSHNVSALPSTSLIPKWSCFSAFVPMAGVWKLWFDTGSFVRVLCKMF